MRAAIVGGGISGLWTAWELLRGGAQVELYEAAPQAGGLAGCFEREGHRFDYGPHEFVTQDARLRERLAELCGPDLIEVEKRTAQHFRGRSLRYPFELGDLLRGLGPRACARMLAGVARARLDAARRPPAADSFESWTRARFGDALYREYFEPYTRKVWGIDPRLLDARTAQARVAVDSLRQLVLQTLRYSLLGRDGEHAPHSELRKSFLYVRGGMGELQRKLRLEVERLGGRVHLGRALVGLERGPDGCATRLHFADGSSTAGFEALVSTIPLAQLAQLALVESVAAALRARPLEHRGMVFGFVRVRAANVLGHHWIYYPEAEIPFQRATEFTHFGAQLNPPGESGLALELAADPGDALWQSSDAHLLGRCTQALARVADFDPALVLGADFVRVRCAYPLQTIGFREAADALLEQLGAVPNLVSLGRQGLFRYCNMDECAGMALELAPRLLAGERGLRVSASDAWRGVAHEGRDRQGAVARALPRPLPVWRRAAL
jgi:protoporphyrinogen oxidase